MCVGRASNVTVGGIVVIFLDFKESLGRNGCEWLRAGLAGAVPGMLYSNLSRVFCC